MTEPVKAKKTAKKKAPSKAPKVAKKTKAEAPQKDLYAVIATGGKQYRVSVGDLVKIEKINDELKEGDSLSFDKVLLIDNGSTEATIGTPFIKEAEVKATLNKIARYKTIDVIKYKQKSRYFKKYGHRQPYFEVKIEEIK